MKPLRPARIPLALLALSLVVACAPRAQAAPTALPDSTFVEEWKLSNGLHVSARHVPNAEGVAIAVAYGTGSAADPTGREGLAWLLAETRFTAAAGEVPERARSEMNGLRPLGWQVKVLPRVTVFIEMASPKQFPGVLHQVAQRMRGVTVTPDLVAAALASVQKDLHGLYRDNPDTVAYLLPRELAAGRDPAALARLASGEALSAIPAKEVDQLQAARFVPANAVVGIAGNLGAADLRPFLEHELGSIPAGVAPPAPRIALHPASLQRQVAGLVGVAGTVGVIAPPITDPNHPEFYLTALLMGARARAMWGPPLPPLTSRFRYSLFDDPDLFRFFPPMDPEQGDTTWVAQRLEEVLEPMARAVMPGDAIDDLKRSVFWMFGGPMMPALVVQARNDPGTLANLASTIAVRLVWQPESFWADYRKRFADITTVSTETWGTWAIQSKHQVKLVLEPAHR